MAEESRQHGRLELISQIVKFRVAELKKSKTYVAVLVLMVAAIFFVHDIYVDVVVEGVGPQHVVLEGGIFLAVLVALGIEVARVVELNSANSASQKEIQRLKAHLSSVIVDEFNSWGLSDSEKEIALLLIKGLSMQEIATIRKVKEKSVRQQATGIYTKAGVASRYELAAYFIEDFLDPDLAS